VVMQRGVDLGHHRLEPPQVREQRVVGLRASRYP